MFKVPTIGSHTGSQALGEACHSLVDRRLNAMSKGTLEKKIVC